MTNIVLFARDLNRAGEWIRDYAKDKGPCKISMTNARADVGDVRIHILLPGQALDRLQGLEISDVRYLWYPPFETEMFIRSRMRPK